MTHEQLLKYHLKKVTEWEETEEWYKDRLTKVREKRLINQIRSLLVENQQLHTELEVYRQKEELWISANKHNISGRI